MSETFILDSIFPIRPGRTEEFVKAAEGVVDLLEANPTRHLYFAICVNDAGTAYRNLQIHPDAESMGEHLALISDHLQNVAELIDFEGGDEQLYGHPGALARHPALADAAASAPVAGFTRLTTAGERAAAGGPIVFMNSYRLHAGQADAYEAALPDWFDWLEAEHPRMLHFKVYLADDGVTITTVQVHPDARSMEFQLQLIAGRVHEQWMPLIDWSTFGIRLVGSPTPALLEAMHAISGPDASIDVWTPTVGFSRLPV